MKTLDAKHTPHPVRHTPVDSRTPQEHTQKYKPSNAAVDSFRVKRYWYERDDSFKKTDAKEAGSIIW
jgi:hypothetical protein